MRKDLDDVISTSKEVRDRLLSGTLANKLSDAVKIANSVALNNHNIVVVRGLELRKRILDSQLKAMESLAQVRLIDHAETKSYPQPEVS